MEEQGSNLHLQNQHFKLAPFFRHLGSQFKSPHPRASGVNNFYKVDKAHTREYGGNGIGLSIVKAIMESFRQQYGVKNYDNGVEFWCEFDVS